MFVPKIDPVEGKMDFVQVHGEDDLSTFPAGLWGIREPDYVWKDQPRKRGQFSATSSRRQFFIVRANSP